MARRDLQIQQLELLSTNATNEEISKLTSAPQQYAHLQAQELQLPQPEEIQPQIEVISEGQDLIQAENINDNSMQEYLELFARLNLALLDGNSPVCLRIRYYLPAFTRAVLGLSKVPAPGTPSIGKLNDSLPPVPLDTIKFAKIFQEHYLSNTLADDLLKFIHQLGASAGVEFPTLPKSSAKLLKAINLSSSVCKQSFKFKLADFLVEVCNNKCQRLRLQ